MAVDPFVVLVPYEDSPGQYEWCCLCEQWSDRNHLRSRKHLGKVFWFDQRAWPLTFPADCQRLPAAAQPPLPAEPPPGITPAAPPPPPPPRDLEAEINDLKSAVEQLTATVEELKAQVEEIRARSASSSSVVFVNGIQDWSESPNDEVISGES